MQSRHHSWFFGIALLVTMLLSGMLGGAAGWFAARHIAPSRDGIPQPMMTPSLPAPPTSAGTDLQTRIEAVYQQRGAGVVNITTR